MKVGEAPTNNFFHNSISARKPYHLYNKIMSAMMYASTSSLKKYWRANSIQPSVVNNRKATSSLLKHENATIRGVSERGGSAYLEMRIKWEAWKYWHGGNWAEIAALGNSVASLNISNKTMQWYRRMANGEKRASRKRNIARQRRRHYHASIKPPLKAIYWSIFH